jgi:hypothetical protein
MQDIFMYRIPGGTPEDDVLSVREVVVGLHRQRVLEFSISPFVGDKVAIDMAKNSVGHLHRALGEWLERAYDGR